MRWISMLVTAAVLAAASGARAGEHDDPDRAKNTARLRMRDAEQAMAAAAVDGSKEAWNEAGQQFLDAAQSAPLIGRTDEAWWYAGWCLAHAGLPGVAMQALKRLIDEHPKSAFAPRAMVLLAQIEFSVAWFEKAAATYAEHAARYAAEPDAMDSLENAARLYAIVGDDERAVRAVDAFAKLYGAKQRERAAGLIESVAAIADEAGRAETAAPLYRRFVALAPSDRIGRTLAAQVRLASMTLRASCPVLLQDGLCTRIDRRSGRRIAVARTKRTAAEALAGFAAVGRGGGGGWDPRDDVKPAWAEANLHLAERDVEAVLATPPMPPIGNGSRQALQRIERWQHAWMAKARVAVRALEDLVSLRTRVSVTAAARIAVLTDAMADTDPSAPFVAQARHAAGVCMMLATELNAVGDDVTTCERILVRRDPVNFPPRRERLGPYAELPPITGVEP